MAVPELRVRTRTRLARCLRAHSSLSPTDTAGTLLVLVSAEVEGSRSADARAHADEFLAMLSDETGTLPVKALWKAAECLSDRGGGG
ncbi:hypothetical protein [Streptomyces sp. NPDC059894]|uniref:hypothetical protein n=1 Tax=unclassified Streptomyces TaxID=2593676 RepID=UPI00364A1A1E